MQIPKMKYAPTTISLLSIFLFAFVFVQQSSANSFRGSSGQRNEVAEAEGTIVVTVLEQHIENGRHQTKQQRTLMKGKKKGKPSKSESNDNKESSDSSNDSESSEDEIQNGDTLVIECDQVIELPASLNLFFVTIVLEGDNAATFNDFFSLLLECGGELKAFIATTFQDEPPLFFEPEDPFRVSCEADLTLTSTCN